AASELERAIVAVLDGRDRGTGVLPDVEVFVLRGHDGCRVIHGLIVQLLPVHEESTRATLAEAAAVELEVEHDGVLASRQLRPFPRRALEIEQVVEEHRLAPADAQVALAQE